MDSPPPGMVKPVSFEFDKLGFLLDHPEPDNPAAQVLSDLLFIQIKFEAWVQLVDLRSTTMIQDAYPLLLSLPAEVRRPDALKSEAHYHVYRRLASLTSEIIKRTDELIEQLESLYGRMKAGLTFVLPKAHFIELKFPQPATTNGSDNSPTQTIPEKSK